MTVKLALLALLEAKPGKGGGGRAAFLEGGLSIAAAKEGTRDLVRLQDQRHELRHFRHL